MNTNFVINFSNHAAVAHSGLPKAVIEIALALFIGVLCVIGKSGKNSN